MDKLQIERMNKINELIGVIADTDRRFFYAESRISQFVNDNKLFFIDKYTNKRIYPYLISKHISFSDGGTLWALVNDFREWIITGKRSNGNNGYGGLYCTHWGYTIDGMDKVINKAKAIGYLDNDSQSFREMCQSIMDKGNEWLLGSTIKEELGVLN